jgi:5-hydroxyisourate hydrolase-like protein (transthyretin family)
MTRSKKKLGAAAAAVAAIALLAGGLASPATAATGRATVKGVVKLDGKPVKTARVTLYRDMGDDVDDPDYKKVKTVSTDSKGRYKISGVSLIKLSPEAAGYAIVANDRAGKFVKTHRPVHLKAGKVVTRNVKTLPAAIIKGKITRSDGGDPRQLQVTIGDDEPEDNYYVPQFDPNEDAKIWADGTFKIGGVAPNGYHALKVRGKPYAPQCFTPAIGTFADCDGSSAQWIKVSAGQRLKIPAFTVTKLR